MAGWLKFMILWAITGNPVVAALIVIVFWGVADWYTFGFLRGGVRVVRNIQRVSRLSQVIEINPHDRKARADLGEALLALHAFERAIRVLKPAVDADPDDANALCLLGLACLGAGKVEQGELFLKSVLEADPKHRQGEPLLELGRFRLLRGDARAAIEALRQYLAVYASSVEGRYLLSRALRRVGDDAGADAERRRAWTEYATALPFQRRAERLWAWRARPSRPLIYAAVLICGCLALGYFARGTSLGRAGIPGLPGSSATSVDPGE